MKKQNSGFTLIELVVVIVILGILAATAIPRFANLSDNARQSVAQGILGSLLSSAVIQYGENNGNPVKFASIINNTDVNTTDSVAVDVDSSGYVLYSAASSETCNGSGDTTLKVRVDGDDATAGGQEAVGTIPGEICNN